MANGIETMIKNGDIYLVKFAEAHMYIGRTYLSEHGVRITHPRCLRYWGTQRGLGELYKGPTGSTTLDLSSDLFVPLLRVNCIMSLDQKGWAKHIAKHENGE